MGNVNLEPVYQEQLLAVIPKFTGALGIPSSILLMHEVYVAHRGGGGNTILRTLAGIAFFLSLDALGWFLSTWAVPVDSGFAFAAGNVRTCEFQGFLLQAVIGAPLLTCAMSWYFYLIVAMGKSATELVGYEKIVTPLIILYAFGSAFLLLGLDQYNHVGAVCWVQGSPPACGNSAFSPAPDAPPCERGNWAWLYGMAMFYGLIWISIVLIFIFNVCIYWKLRTEANRREARWFAVQSFLYGAAFCVTWAPSTTWSGMNWTAEGGSFTVDVLSAFFEPLGGFWNLVIFVRDRPSSRARVLRIICCEFMETSTEECNKVDKYGATSSESNSPGNNNATNDNVIPEESGAIDRQSSCYTGNDSEFERKEMAI